MITDPLRLRHPYERSAKKWNRITWPEAYRKISQGLRGLISKHGKNSVAL